MRLVSALISSPHLHIEPFAHQVRSFRWTRQQNPKPQTPDISCQIMPAVITCIVCKALGGQRSDVAPFAQVHDHWCSAISQQIPTVLSFQAPQHILRCNTTTQHPFNLIRALPLNPRPPGSSVTARLFLSFESCSAMAPPIPHSSRAPCAPCCTRCWTRQRCVRVVVVVIITRTA